MKHVLYIGQPYDPLEQLDVQNRKKVGITASTQLLPSREGQLKRDAGTIMPFGYVVVKAWEFEKKIFFYNPLPDCSFTDELKGINPRVIHGDLGLVA